MDTTPFHTLLYSLTGPGVTGPASLAASTAGTWGSPPTSPERGKTAGVALDALEAKLRDANYPEWVQRHAVGG